MPIQAQRTNAKTFVTVRAAEDGCKDQTILLGEAEDAEASEDLEKFSHDFDYI